MSKLMILADIHLKTGQKNVPVRWQVNRFMLLAQKIAESCAAHNIETAVIAGDLLDVASPSLHDIGLLYDFLVEIRVPVILIPGNHEMVNKSLDCYSYIESILRSLNVRVIRDFETIDGIDYIPYNILKDKTWPTPKSKYCITHVRGEIPPHVTPEIDLDKFNDYEKVFAGDLHSHTNSQRNIYYPGSPLSTSFHRSVVTGANGYFIFNSNTGNHTWVELHLPQLIRKTITSKEEMIETYPHHTVYELEGTLEQLKDVAGSELLDKKITTGISAPPKLEMSGDIGNELATYLVEVKGIKDPSKYVEALLEIVPNAS